VTATRKRKGAPKRATAKQRSYYDLYAAVVAKLEELRPLLTKVLPDTDVHVSLSGAADHRIIDIAIVEKSTRRLKRVPRRSKG